MEPKWKHWTEEQCEERGCCQNYMGGGKGRGARPFAPPLAKALKQHFSNHGGREKNLLAKSNFTQHLIKTNIWHLF